jgi:hypothetical protein
MRPIVGDSVSKRLLLAQSGHGCHFLEIWWAERPSLCSTLV